MTAEDEASRATVQLGDRLLARMKASEAKRRQAVAQLTPQPDPTSVQSIEEFVRKMRQLRAYVGLTLREISERTGTHGELPRSTLSDALKAKSLPNPTLLRRFLQACGLTDDQVAVWEATRRRIAMEEAS